jgi:hypothetical protein
MRRLIAVLLLGAIMPWVGDGYGGPEQWVDDANSMEEMARVLGFPSLAAWQAEQARTASLPGAGGFFKTLMDDTVKPWAEGAKTFVTSPEFAAVAGAGMGANYAMTGSPFTAAPAVGASGVGGAGTATMGLRGGDALSAAAPDEFGLDAVYGDIGPKGVNVNGVGSNVYGANFLPNGGYSATADEFGLEPSFGGVGPQGVQVPGVGNVFGSPAMLLKAVKDGLLPAATLKGMLGKGSAIDGILKMMQSGQDTSALSRMTGISPDLLDVLGKVAGAGLGVYGANQQADSFRRLSDDAMTRWNQSVAMGAPSRDRYEASFKPGFTMGSDPGYQDALDATTKSTLHGLSITGNPSTSPNAWNQTLSDVNSKFAYPALQNYRTMNANTGGFSSFANAGAQGPNMSAATAAIGADAKALNAIGAGIADVTTPPKNTLEEFFKSNIFQVRQ